MVSKVKRLLRDVESFEWHHRNLILIFISIFVAYLLIKNPYIHQLLSNLGTFGYFGAFAVGVFFAYGITTPLATASFFILGETLNLFWLALFGAFGSVLGNYFIFSLFRNRLSKELKYVLDKELHLKVPILRKLFHSKIFMNSAPLIAGFILASPLPDEFAILIFGAVHFNPKKFLIYSFVFHFVGIFFVSFLGSL